MQPDCFTMSYHYYEEHEYYGGTWIRKMPPDFHYTQEQPDLRIGDGYQTAATNSKPDWKKNYAMPTTIIWGVWLIPVSNTFIQRALMHKTNMISIRGINYKWNYFTTNTLRKTANNLREVNKQNKLNELNICFLEE